MKLSTFAVRCLWGACAAAWPLELSAQEIEVRTVEDRERVTVMELGAVYDHQPRGSQAYELAVRKAIAREFLRTHADDYDFLVTFTGFDFALGSDNDGHVVGGRHYPIKNDVDGIGLGRFDASAEWGSAGRLQSFIDMGVLAKIASDPTSPQFEQTLGILAHELGHRWSSYVRFQDANGAISPALLGLEQAHWTFLLQSYNSVFYGNDWRDNGDGTFTSIGRSRAFYSPLDLYLMGMIDKSHVPPFFLIQTSSDESNRLPELGVTITGTAKPITIDDVIAAEGPRLPSAQDAPKRFKVGFVFLVRPGQQAQGIELTAINTIRDAFATRFLILTNGKGVVEVYPEPPPAPIEPPPPVLPPSSGPRTTPFDTLQATDWLISRQQSSGAWADSAWTRVRDTATVVDLLKQVPSAALQAQRGLASLTTLPAPSNVDSIARRISALAPQFPPADVTFLADARAPGGGWGLGPGYRADPLDTALALRAVAAYAPGDLTALTSVQNADAGWGSQPGAPSSVSATLAVLQLTDRYQMTPLNAALIGAFNWLQAHQNPDGGFGDAASTPYETAEAMLFLTRTAWPKEALVRATDFLKATQLADGSWNESVYETALAVRALKTSELPNLAVNESSVSFSIVQPVEGATVTITAMVANEGVKAVQAVAIRFYDGDPSAGATPIGGPVQIGPIAPLTQVPAAVLWDTTAKGGTHRIFVVVDPDGAVNEYNEADNTAEKILTVGTAPVDPDFAVGAGDVVLAPASLLAIPQQQQLTVSIHNVGQTAATQVGVSAYEIGSGGGDLPVGQAVVDLPARGTAVATFTFTVSTPGDHRYRIVVDPANSVAEADENNNTAIVVLRPARTLDLYVVPGSVVFSANPIALGQDLMISATVGNQGTTDAFTVPVRFFIDDPTGPIDVATQPLTLAAGETRTVSATWRTSRPLAAVPVIVEVDPLNAVAEVSEANNTAAASLTVTASSDPNLLVRAAELQVTSPVDQGGQATITAIVHNTGGTAATNVEVAFFLGNPSSGGTQIGSTQTIAAMSAGAQVPVSITWSSIATSGTKLVYVVVDPGGRIGEFDEQDNAAFITVKVRSLADLAVTSASLVFTPAFPRQGDTVAITATIANTGEQPAANVKVLFLDDGAPIGGVQNIASIAGGGQATAQIAFTNTSTSGVRTLTVQVDPGNEIVEQDESNNTASRTLGIQDASLWFTNPYFSPNGDDAKDTTDLFFRLDAGQAVGATLFGPDDAAVRRLDVGGAQATGNIAWDGRSDTGTVVPDGKYELALNGSGSIELARSRVFVDTNSSPISEALGTKYLLQQNLTCGMNNVSGYGYTVPFATAGWLPDDSGLIKWFPTSAICSGQGSCGYWSCRYTYTDTVPGVYLVTPDGQQRRLTPDTWAVHPPAGDGVEIFRVEVSENGDKILIGLMRYGIDPWCGERSYRAPYELWVMNTDGSGLTLAATTPSDAYLDPPYNYSIDMALSPDGSRVAYSTRTSGSYQYRLAIAAVDGSGAAVVPAGDLYDFAWSPDSTHVVYSTYEDMQRVYAIKADGTGKTLVAASRGGGLDYLTSNDDVFWLGADRFAVRMSYVVMTPAGFFDYGNGDSLWLFSTTGEAPRQIATGESIGTPVAAPDGQSIVFTDSASDLWRLNLDTSLDHVYSQSTNVRYVGDPFFSADSRWIAFEEQFVTEDKWCPGPEGGTEFCGRSFPALVRVDAVNGGAMLRPLGPEGSGGSAIGNLTNLSGIGLTPDGRSYLVSADTADGQRIVAALDVETGEIGTVLDDQWASNFRFTPSRRYLLYESAKESQPGGACWNPVSGNYGEPNDWLLGSLLNLTTQLAFTREQSQLVIRGTAEDVNFSRYSLEYAPVSPVLSWSLIAPPSDAPVINDVLARWIPPGEGSFYVRLTAEDKAGNVAVSRKRITWGLTPSITNVIIAPPLFSPNGDGVRDTVSISYTVLGPINLTFEIFDQTGTLVRTIQQSHAALGGASIAWDGRDDSGQFVSDGEYRIHVLDFDFFVTADTVAPVVRLALPSALALLPQLVVCTDPPAIICSSYPGPLVQAPPRHQLTGRVTDPDLAGWKLEAGDGPNPDAWRLVEEGTAPRLNGGDGSSGDTTLLTFGSMTELVGKRFRVTATDRAGNTATAVSDFAPEEIILHGFDTLPVPSLLAIEQKLGPHVLRADQTVRSPLQVLRVQYRLQGTLLWSDGAAVSLPPPNVELAWDNTGLMAGKTYEVRLLGVDVEGSQYASNSTFIHSDLFVMTAYLEDLNLTQGLASLREPLTEIRLVTVGQGADEKEIGSNRVTPGNDASFQIPVAADPTLKPCQGYTVSARYRGVGQSGRIYYSNSMVVSVLPPPSMVSCGGEFRLPAELTLGVERAYASCGLPNPEKVELKIGRTIINGTQGLAVQDVPNGALRDVAIPNVPTAVVVDTHSRPEGTYAVRATGQGIGSRTDYAETATFVVDRVPPTSRITYPGTNQAFCAVSNGTRVVVPVEGIAEDVNFTKYEMAWGMGENPVSWSSFFPAAGATGAGTSATRGPLGNWDVTGLPRGTYSLQLKAYDAGGNMTCGTVTFFLQGDAHLQNVIADRRLISPNSDGIADSITVSFGLDQNATVDVKVYPIVNGQTGSMPVRTILSKVMLLEGANSVLWDGRGDGGASAPDGDYAIVLSLIDACGHGAQASVPVSVDLAPPDGSITSPTIDTPVGVAVEVRGSITDLHFQRYSLEVARDPAQTWTLLASGATPVVNDLLGRWNNQGQQGSYTLRLTGVDLAGNSREILLPVTVGAMQPIVTSISAEPALFSPNADGRKDATTIGYVLNEAAHVTLEIATADGTLVRTLASGIDSSAGSHSVAWDGGGVTGPVVPDGDYRIRITAIATADSSRTQTEQTTARVDTTPPAIAIDVPADGYARGEVRVRGSVTDQNIDAYAAAFGNASGGPAITLDESHQSRTAYEFGTLPELADGSYIVRIAASDLAGNQSEVTRTFTIDNTAPRSALSAPDEGALLGGATPIPIRGLVSDANLDEWVLRFAGGADPSAWTSIARGGTPPVGDALGAWDAAAVPDGTYAVSLLATDKASATAEARRSITIDNTRPTARILVPGDGAHVTGPVEIGGEASDAHFKSAVLELSRGVAATAFEYVPLAHLDAASIASPIFNWQALPADGTYTLRLTVDDLVGLRSVATATVVLDTHPPSAIAGLTAHVENRRDVRLTWTASSEPELAGYHIYRDGVRITATPVTGNERVDANLADGTYRYAVTVVDLANLESERSNEATAHIDLTPPSVKIQTPANGTAVSEIVEIRGSATAIDDFKEYRVLAGIGAAPDTFTMIRRSPAPVVSALLAEWDTAQLAAGATYSIRLEAEDLAGNVASDQIVVTVDNAAPGTPVLVSAVPSSSDVVLQWQANSEPDLAGYLLYSNDVLANVRRIVTGSMTPYLLAGTTYADKALPDGDYRYYLFAVDRAGNISGQSNVLSATVETRAPRATIVQPATGTKVDRAVQLVASTPDRDVARVQFEVFDDASGWVALGGPATTSPYRASWNPAGLSYGTYHFRAVATDTHGNTDPAPPEIAIVYGDLTAPATPQGPRVRVTAGDVGLTWSAATETDLAGYHVYRSNGPADPSRITSAPLTDAAFTDVNVTDGTYFYAISAIDTAGNESALSVSVPARVYTPSLVISACVGASPVSGVGGGPEAGSLVRVFADTGQGFTEVATTTAAGGQEGQTFQLDVPLAAGQNVLYVQATDASGNTSKPSSPVSVNYSPLPTAPAGLTATADGMDVTLAWDPVDGRGYNLYRDGELVNAPRDVTASGTTGASSSYSYYRPWYATDGNPDSAWSPYYWDYSFPWWQITFGQETAIGRVEIEWLDWAAAPSEYAVVYADGSGWSSLKSVTGNSEYRSVLRPAGAISTSALRVSFSYPANMPYLAEFRVFTQPQITGSTYTDLAQTNGRHTYRLAGVNACGVEGAPSQAEVNVGDVTPPAAVTLTASVDRSTVTLTWTASPDPDLAGYNLDRAIGDGDWTRVNAAVLAGTSFEDVVPNGTYRYRVTAIDRLGNASVPSNEAMAIVAVQPPGAPIQLAVSAPASGKALDLSWAAGGGEITVGYHVFRAITSAGPYDRITTESVAGFTYRDTGVANGTRYYYTVRGTDIAGNVGDPSNEASGIPRDTVAPGAPVLMYPTDADHPKVIDASTTPVAGLAEPGTTVTLLEQGLPVGTAPALASAATRSTPLPGSVYSASFAADGFLAYVVQPQGSSASVVAVTDAVSGATRIYSGLPEPSTVAFSPDAATIAVVAYASGRYQLHLVDRSTGAIGKSIALPGYMSPVYSPDGNFIASDYNNQIWTVDLATGTATSRTSDTNYDYYPVWSPDGAKIAYINFTFDGSSLRLLDVATGSVTVIDTVANPEPPVFSSDGSRLLFSSSRSGHLDLWTYDLATGETLAAPPDSSSFQERSASIFSPDGTALAYIGRPATTATCALRIQNLATGAVQTVAETNRCGRPYWARDAALNLLDDTMLLRAMLPGRFQVDSLALSEGENIVSAIAADDAGNVSGPAEPITLIGGTPLLPDLTVRTADLFAYPEFAAPGERVYVSAIVRNDGTVASSPTSVTFTVEQTGTISPIGTPEQIAAIPAGGELAVWTELDTTGRVGRQRVRITVDPYNRVTEASEANNSATIDAFVTATSTPTVSVSTDRSEYLPGMVAFGTVDVTNPGFAGDFVLDVRVEDSLGSVLATPSHVDLPAFGYASRTVVATWSSIGAVAGTYRIHALLTRSTGEVLEASAEFRVAAERKATARITTDRAVYTTGQTVSASATIVNGSANSDLTGLTAVMVVRAADGAEMYRTENAVGTVLLGGTATSSAQWPASLPGSYAIQLTIAAGGVDIATATHAFSVVGIASLDGQLQLAPARAAVGAPVAVTARVSNTGSLPAANAVLRVAVVDAVSQTLRRSFERTADIGTGAQLSWPVAIDTAGLGINSYRVVLSAQLTSGSPQTLATTSFFIVDERAPTVTLLSPDAGSFHDRPVPISVTVADDASGIDVVEFQVDSGAWSRLPLQDAVTGRYGVMYTATADTEGTHTVTIRAADRAGNGEDTSSADANPVSVPFTIDVTPPQVIIGGITDEAFVNHDVTPVVTVTDVNLASSSTTLDGVSFVTGTVIAAEGPHTLAVDAVDRVGHAAHAAVRFVIDKTPPAIVIAGVADRETYGTAVMPIVEITDANLLGTTVLVDGAPFSNGSVVSTDGAHVLAVVASDRASNTSSRTISFGIDTQPPAIAITGVEDGKTYGANVAPVITVTDASSFSQTITLNGEPFVSGTAVQHSGRYLLLVSAVDRFEHASTATVSFTINTLPIAVDGHVATLEDTAVDIALAATDTDGDSLEYRVVTPPQHGVLAGVPPALVFTPAPDFNGADRFTFVADDGIGASNEAAVEIVVAPVNDAPVAVSGPDQTANESSLVILDASASYDIDGDAITFVWNQTAGPEVHLDDPAGMMPRFLTPPVPQGGATLTFRVIASDGQATSAPASVNITVKNVNNRPVAVAGVDQRVKEETVVTLDGSASYDSDAEPVSYEWTQISGPAVTLSDSHAVSPSFVAPKVGRTGAVLTFALIVTDGLDVSIPDETTVTVEHVNHPPVANAGADLTRNESALVTLDGSASSDPDGDAITFLWTQTAGTPVTLSDPTSPTPTFTAPSVTTGGATLAFRLVVNDGIANSAPDAVTVSVLNTNDPPVCGLAAPSAATLWPPDHKLVPIQVTNVADPNNDRVRITVTAVTQDEPVDGLGDGDTSPDAVIQGGSVLIRSERSGKGDGRVYWIQFVADDGQDGVCSGVVKVGVPHDGKPKEEIVDSGQRFDSTKR